MSKKKPASLSSSLLSKDKSDSSAGFVISLVDKRKGAGKPKAKAGPKDATGPGAGLSYEQPAKAAKAGEDRRASAPDRLVRQLNLKGRRDSGRTATEATAQHLVQALRQGLAAQAEEIFARMTGLNAGNVQRVLYGAEGRNLAVACRALDIEQLQFVSIFILSHRLGLGEKAPSPHKLTQVVHHFDQTDQETARRMLNRWLHASPEE
jgi:hypothetical protein